MFVPVRFNVGGIVRWTNWPLGRVLVLADDWCTLSLENEASVVLDVATNGVPRMPTRVQALAEVLITTGVPADVLTTSGTTRPFGAAAADCRWPRCTGTEEFWHCKALVDVWAGLPWRDVGRWEVGKLVAASVQSCGGISLMTGWLLMTSEKHKLLQAPTTSPSRDADAPFESIKILFDSIKASADCCIISVFISCTGNGKTPAAMESLDALLVLDTDSAASCWADKNNDVKEDELNAEWQGFPVIITDVLQLSSWASWEREFPTVIADVLHLLSWCSGSVLWVKSSES